MRLTRDESFRIIDSLTDFLEDRLGQQVTVKREVDSFTVVVGAKKVMSLEIDTKPEELDCE